MARVKSLAGSTIEQYDSPNKGGTMSDHRGTVLHIAEGTYRGTISWQMNPDQRYASGGTVTTCSTWIVGKDRGEWAQMVDSDRIAWCQRDGSRTWTSIELAGYAPDGPTEWQIDACAQLLAWQHRIHGVPLAVADHPGERGLGHHSMDREWLGEEWGHDSCPGSGVIAAKAAIVQRAQAIVAGEDDDMSWDETLTTKGGVSATAERFVTDTADRTYTMANTTLPQLRAEVAGLRTDLAAVRAELAALRATPPAAVSREDLEAVLRSVLGSLDGATGAGS